MPPVFGLGVLAVLLGIAFRFANLNAPLFWQDEAVTALRVTGHTKADLLPLFDGRIHPVAAVAKLTAVDPRRGVAAAVASLAHEEPQHPPLFYVLDRVWVGAFGATPAAFRGASAFVGTLGIGLAFALAATLLRSRAAGTVAASLYALSPFFILYARQAREYALFPCATILATVAFVLASRDGTLLRWAAYAGTVAAGLYVDPIFALVVAGHGLSAGLEGGARIERLRAWLVASLLGAFAFAPWALGAARASGAIAAQLDWGHVSYPLGLALQKWVFNAGALAFDAEFADLRLVPLAAAVALGAAAAFVAFVRTGSREAVRVVVPLALLTPLAFVVRDTLGGSHFATIPRYISPLWVGLLVAASAVLGRAIESPLRRARALGIATFAALLAAGAWSGFARGGAENWWDNNDQIAYQAMARAIDRTERPLVITQDRPIVPLVLARYLRPDAEFLAFDSPVPDIPAGRNAFLIAPTDAVRAAIAAKTRGTYRLANVSPRTSTIIGGFHRDLARAKPETLRGDTAAFVPENALWALEPLAKRRPQR